MPGASRKATALLKFFLLVLDIRGDVTVEGRPLGDDHVVGPFVLAFEKHVVSHSSEISSVVVVLCVSMVSQVSLVQLGDVVLLLRQVDSYGFIRHHQIISQTCEDISFSSPI